MIRYIRPPVYPKQKEFIECEARYTIVEASTKAGKTVSCIIWILEQAIQGKDGDNYWWVAPVYPQAKIAFTRLKRFIKDKDVFKANETELKITLFNGACIWFKSGEKPDNLYGDDVKAAVIDESTRVREESFWALRSTLTATGGKCKIIGNVKGEHNWAYKLAREAEKGDNPELAYFKLTAYDAVEGGVIDAKEIEDAKRIYPQDVFDELYLCIPRKNKTNLFAYCFDDDKHIRDSLEFVNKETYLSFDFNINPITCIASQHYDNKIRILKEFRLENSDIYKLCTAIKSELGNRLFVITGDASGTARNALTRGDMNYYKVIKSELRLANNQIRVPKFNPSISNSHLLTNSLLARHDDLFIDSSCKYLIEDLKLVETKLKSNGDVDIDKSDVKRSHLLDCLRYYFNTFHAKFIDKV